MGRSDAFATEHDLEAEEYVPLPKGDVFKKKEVIQVRNLFFTRTSSDTNPDTLITFVR